jgi:tRNA(Phe) wybutosine-synthesizing methylase Tyw3
MEILRSWREIRVMMRYRFPILTENDFIIMDEDKESTLERLASKLQKSRTELDKLMADLQRL